MTKIFSIPFAADGDKVSPPDSVQADGSVSYSLGYGFDYQRDTGVDEGGAPVDPLAKVFPREQHNGILNDITTAIGEMQLNGLAIWQASASPYANNALVRHAGSNWKSVVPNNTSIPGAPGSAWVPPEYQPEATESVRGIAFIATQKKVSDGADDYSIVTPLKLARQVTQATEARSGIAKISTTQLAISGADDTTMMTPIKVKSAMDSKLPFVPVEQGGAPGMFTNKVKIGWNGFGLSARVDATDLGSFVFNSPGDVVITTANTAPPGTLKMNGSAISRTGYPALFARIGTRYGAGDGSTSFNIPDARAEFIRGLDDGRGIDAGRVLGSYQADSVRSVGIFGESGNPFAQGGTAGNGYLRTGSGNVVIPAGTETRPRNIAFLLCIRY